MGPTSNQKLCAINTHGQGRNPFYSMAERLFQACRRLTLQAQKAHLSLAKLRSLLTHLQTNAEWPQNWILSTIQLTTWGNSKQGSKQLHIKARPDRDPHKSPVERVKKLISELLLDMVWGRIPGSAAKKEWGRGEQTTDPGPLGTLGEGRPGTAGDLGAAWRSYRSY